MYRGRPGPVQRGGMEGCGQCPVLGPHPVDRQTDMIENITFPQLHWQVANIDILQSSQKYLKFEIDIEKENEILIARKFNV